MRRYFCLLVILASIGFTKGKCNNEERHFEIQNLECNEVSYDDLTSTFLYIGRGNCNVLAFKYADGLEDFEKAEACLKKLKEPIPGLELLINIGKTIAFDQIEMIPECEKSLYILSKLLNESDDEIKETGFSDFQRDDSSESRRNAASLLKKLASHSRSLIVKNNLEMIIAEVEGLSPYEFSKQNPYMLNDWTFDSGVQKYEIMSSKSLWKKIKTILNDLPELIEWMGRLLKAAKDFNDIAAS